MKYILAIFLNRVEIYDLLKFSLLILFFLFFPFIIVQVEQFVLMRKNKIEAHD